MTMPRLLLLLLVVATATPAYAQLTPAVTVDLTGPALVSLQSLDDLVKHEDDPSANLDPGIVFLCRRTASPANTSGADLDYEACQMNAGRVWVSASIENASSDRAEDSPDVDAATGPAIVNVRRDTPVASSSATDEYATFNSNSRGGVWMTPLADKAGGSLNLKYTSVGGSTEDKHAVCTTACTVYSITATNTNAAARYIRCENDTSGNTAPGSETPELDLAIPGATAGAGFVTTFNVGTRFATALTCWLVTGAADTDVAEVAANEIKLFYTYQQ